MTTTRNELIGLAGPEFELMCLSARVSPDESELRRLSALLRVGLDWPKFLSLLERNYVAPLVHRNLSRIDAADAAPVPTKIRETIRVRSRITAWKSESFATELVRLFELFEANSIQIINYKGAAAAGQYYGSVALRNFNDLDFLVRRRDIAAVVDLLEADGYALSGEFTPEQLQHFIAEYKEFVLLRGEFSLEPHWSLAGRRYPFETDYEGFWQRAQAWNMSGTSLRVLAPEDAVLVYCLVGAKGRWQRLQMVCDVAECLRSHPRLDWHPVIEMARATGTVRILHIGLLLACELLGTTLPPDLDRQVRATTTVVRLARDVVGSLAAGPVARRLLADSPSIFSPMLFRQRERARDRWRYLWRTTTTASVLHMRRVPLPKWLHPAYRIVVPLHDYVVIPAWRLMARGNEARLRR